MNLQIIFSKAISKNNDHLMNLRHKKPLNSYKGQASYQDQKLFLNQSKTPFKPQVQGQEHAGKLDKSYLSNKKSLAQLLATFISNSNTAFKANQKKKCFSSTNKDSLVVSKKQKFKNRKASQQVESTQQKKIQAHPYDKKQKNVFKNRAQKDPRTNQIGVIKNTQNIKTIEPFSYQNTQFQNIMNSVNNSNIINYFTNWQQSLKFSHLSQQIPNFLCYNYPIDIPNMQSMHMNMQSNIPSLPLNMPIFDLQSQMKNGLMRQMQIHQNHKKQYEWQTNLKNKQMSITKERQRETHKKQTRIVNSQKPEKIMKRASYHVGIAYMIYLDTLKRSGSQFKNIQEIDPTKQAKRFKQNYPSKV